MFKNTRGRLLGLFTAALWLGSAALVPAVAEAQIYKFKKPDGTVVYTDRLSDLPAKRQAQIAKQEEEAKQRRRALENRLGKEEVQRRDLEAQREQLMRTERDAQARADRLASLDRQIAEIRKRKEARERNKKVWTDRVKKARERVEELLVEFREAQKAYNALATKADFSLLPGQGQQKESLRAERDRLEGELDKAIRELYVVIPEEARKAGIPPGWLR